MCTRCTEFSIDTYNKVIIMKQLLFIILVICIFLMVGCQEDVPIEAPTELDPPYLDATWEETTNPPQTESTIGGTTPDTEERSDATTATQPVSPESTTAPTEGKAKNDNKEPATTVTEPAATTAPPTEATNPPTEAATQPTEAVKPTDPPTEERSPQATEPTEPEVSKATAADVQAIAAKMVEYLNAYRLEQGSPAATVLPGLTQYAEYRSRQLVSNFAHDTADERAAATALEYGSYVDPALFGMTGDPYYTANAREAIAKTDFGGSVEDVAAYLARMTRNSSSHWSYVGGAGYTYIGVGITYENGVWYCDIAVTSKNTDN